MGAVLQFLEEFQVLTPVEKKIVLKNAPLANRLCWGLYFGPGAVKNLLSIVMVGTQSLTYIFCVCSGDDERQDGDEGGGELPELE